MENLPQRTPTIPTGLDEYQKKTLQTLLTKDHPQVRSNPDNQIRWASSCEPYIGNVPAEQQEGALRNVLGKIILLCGVKEAPSREMVVMMLEFLRKHYSRITFAEILIAAELNLAGAIADTDGKRVEHYQQIDIPFITSLLNAYQNRRRQAFAPQARVVEDVDRTRMSHKEAYDGYMKFVKENNAPPTAWNWTGVFRHAYETQQMPMSREQMSAWYELEAQKIDAELMARKKLAANLLERREIEIQMLDEAVKAECRKRFVLEFLTNTPAA